MNLFRELKKPLILITYAAILVAVILNLNYFGGVLGLVLRVSASIAYGIGIAFVLNLLLKLYEDKLLCHLWKRFPKLGRRRRVITVLLTVITTLLILFLLVLFVFPQLTESLMSLMNKIPGYTEELNRMFTEIATRYTFIADFINNTQVNVNEILNASGQFLSVALPTIADFTFGVTNSIVNVFVGLIAGWRRRSSPPSRTVLPQNDARKADPKRVRFFIPFFFSAQAERQPSQAPTQY